MIGTILLLAIVVFGISILFGKAKIENFFSLLIWLIFAPVLLAIGYNHIIWLWYQLPLWAQVMSLLCLPIVLRVVLDTFLPKAKWLSEITRFVFDLLLSIVVFPIRFAWRAFRLLAEKEQRRPQLAPYHAYVGKRPPLSAEPQKRAQKRDLFD